MIYCIGDSHASFFGGIDKMQPIWPEKSNNIFPFFTSIRIGPATAFNLPKKIDLINRIINHENIKDDDILMFCFGEVDVRAHLIKQSIEQNKPIEYIVNECICNYIKVIDYYRFKFKVIVWGPIASWSELNPYVGPSYGTNVERNKITALFNQKLAFECNIRKILFITFFYKMLNHDYTTKYYYLDNWEGSHIHLNQKAMKLVLNDFKKQKLINNNYNFYIFKLFCYIRYFLRKIL